MNQDADNNLGRLFAERREDLDAGAFAAEVSKRIVRRRLFERLGVIALALVLGAAAAALAPSMTPVVAHAIAASSTMLTTVSTFLVAIPYIWLGAGAVALVTAMCVRL